MLNVLIVDDCDLVRSIIAKTLKLARLPLSDLYEASNGQEALQVVQDRQIDVILTDLTMPVMDGFRLVERLDEMGLLRAIPVVVISSGRSTARIEELMKRGVAAYLPKPFSPESVRDIVGNAIGHLDPSDYQGLLADTFGEIVEDFALMLGGRDDECANEQDMQDWVQARLAFRGAYSGTLVAAAPKSLTRKIAANALGIDSNDATAGRFAPEALKEVANLTCGKLVSDIAGEDATIEMSVPILSGYVPSDWREGRGRSTVGFLVEGQPMRLGVSVRSCAL